MKVKSASRLANKIALVTGSTNGIGKATVDLFLENGARVIGVDVLKPDVGEYKAKKLFDFYQMDVSNEYEWQRFSELIVNKYRYLDILVNNAGINGLGHNLGLQDPENIDLNSWRYIHKVNLESIVLGCKYMIKFLKKEEGGDASIINIASRSGLIGVPNLIAYASSKASVINLTKSTALYCAQKKYNIRCNAINPGVIETKLWDNIFGLNEDKVIRKKLLEQDIPLNKMGNPIDVANSVLYLASEEARFITATSITIDGGCTAVTAGRPIRND